MVIIIIIIVVHYMYIYMRNTFCILYMYSQKFCKKYLYIYKHFQLYLLNRQYHNITNKLLWKVVLFDICRVLNQREMSEG